MDKKPNPKSPRETDRDIDEQVEDSFPASDPPSFTAGKRIGRPKRGHEGEQNRKKRSVEPQ
jgi:hypothetical protein